MTCKNSRSKPQKPEKTPIDEKVAAEHDKNGLQNTQRKCPSTSLASVDSVDDGKW